MAVAPSPAEPLLAPNYRLEVTLEGCRPAVWRRLEVSGGTTLRQLHGAIQIAMGWKDYHHYLFRIGELEYGEPDPELPLLPAASVTLADVLGAVGARCLYEYDFGDGWHHRIRVEAISADVPALAPVCLDGGRACPPEDCGGVPGFERLLEAIANPADPEHGEMVTWAGADFDPQRFDLDAVNRQLRRRRSLWPRAPKKDRRSRTDRTVQNLAPWPGPALSAADAELLTTLVMAEMADRGLSLDRPGLAADRAVESVFSRALGLGLRALAAERGIAAGPLPTPPHPDG